MKYGGVVIFVALASGCGGNAVCDPAVFCPGRTNARYAFCNAGSDGCYYAGSDGSKFRCASCGDCSSAQLLAINWCVTAPAETTGETCQAAACTNGRTYQYCTSGDGKQCRYTTGDGKEFKCSGGCTDCTGAASQLTSWCGAVTPNACSSRPTVSECLECCRIANPAGETYIRTNVFPCFCNACSFECGGSQYCGGAGTIGTTCSTCVGNSLQGSCAPWINACMADVGCKSYYTCASACQ